jgi:peptidoglycan/LPS O-acetylase OafA/YrhL
MSATQGTDRDSALDVTKGVLVLLMVLYHWLNYFVSPYGSGYRYIRFITPSFVFLSGYLITSLLVGRRNTSAASLSARLVVRGTKLLVLFTALNIGVAWIEPTRPSGRLPGLDAFIEAFPASYLTGVGTSFMVLLPISYTLILAAVLVKVRSALHLQLSTLAIMSFAVTLALVSSGVEAPTLQLVAAGLLGLIAGSVLGQRLHAIGAGWPWFCLAYVVHLAALALWGVPFTLQLVSVCANLALFYLLGGRIRSGTAPERLLSILGQYALLGYLAQIAILQLLSTASTRVDLGQAEASVVLVATLLLTVGGIVVVDLLRRRLRLVDSVYRLILA